MRIITFAETTPALLAGRKTVTRRDWKPQYAAKFHAGDELAAWDKNPRTKQGKQVAVIRLTADPVLERASDAPEEDFEGEGFGYMTEHGLRLFGGQKPEEVWAWWQASTQTQLWVVRFELVGVTDGGAL